MLVVWSNLLLWYLMSFHLDSTMRVCFNLYVSFVCYVVLFIVNLWGLSFCCLRNSCFHYNHHVVFSVVGCVKFLAWYLFFPCCIKNFVEDFPVIIVCEFFITKFGDDWNYSVCFLASFGRLGLVRFINDNLDPGYTDYLQACRNDFSLCQAVVECALNYLEPH